MVGVTTLPLAKRYPNGRFIAVDAHPIALGEFVRNARLNNLSNVTTVCAAVSESKEPLRIHSARANSGAHRVTGFAGREGDALPEEIVAPAISGLGILAALGIQKADMIKVDTEGYDLHVLRSFGDSLSPGRIPFVISEYGPEGMRVAGTSGWEMVRYMRERGYVCRDLHNDSLIRSECDIPDLPDFGVTDFLFSAA